MKKPVELLQVQILEAKPNKMFTEAERRAVRFLRFNRTVQCAECGRRRGERRRRMAVLTTEEARKHKGDVAWCGKCNGWTVSTRIALASGPWGDGQQIQDSCRGIRSDYRTYRCKDCGHEHTGDYATD